MNLNDEDDDKLKKARLLSVYNFKDRIGVLVIICVICLMIILSSQSVRSNYSSPLVHNTNLMMKNANENIPRRAVVPIVVIRKIPWKGCLYELPSSKDEIVPKHIVPPPMGDVILVCCNTTKGVLNIEVHPTWAPRGADRFLTMVATT
jgi:hypothetical protein